MYDIGEVVCQTMKVSKKPYNKRKRIIGDEIFYRLDIG